MGPPSLIEAWYLAGKLSSPARQLVPTDPKPASEVFPVPTLSFRSLIQPPAKQLTSVVILDIMRYVTIVGS